MHKSITCTNLLFQFYDWLWCTFDTHSKGKASSEVYSLAKEPIGLVCSVFWTDSWVS